MNNKQNWKRVATLSLALLVLVPQVSAQIGGVISTISASADETTYTDGGFTYKLNTTTNEATITGYSGAGGEVTIPDIVSDDTTSYTVTAIGMYAFNGNKTITSVKIPDGVTSIGKWAFEKCTSLSEINIPSSVTSIGEYAFAWCKSLTSIEIPDDVKTIEQYAFCNCTNLAEINIPDNVTSIGDDAFDGCKSLTSITIPDGVTYIGSWAFGSCTSLTSITIPSSVTSIGDDAFDGCTGLKSITIPNSVTSIGRWAFDDCTNLKTFYYPKDKSSLLNKASVPNTATQIAYTINTATLEDKEEIKTATINTITLASGTTVEELELVSTIDGSPVTAISSDALNTLNSNSSTLTTIYYPSSITDATFDATTQIAYSISDGKVTIDSVKLPTDTTTFEVPEKIGDYQVTAIADGALQDLNITTLKLDGVTYTKNTTDDGKETTWEVTDIELAEGVESVTIPETLFGKDVVVPKALGNLVTHDHIFSEYISDNNATCTADGTKTSTCTKCDATNTITDEGSATGHSYGSYTTTRYATCTSTGTRVATCKLCNSTDYKYISKKNHSYGDAVFTWLDNTCTASIECETCGDTLTDDCNITTEEQSDKTIYTATVELNGDTYTSTQEIAKPEETTVTTTEETTVTTTEETTVTTTETTTNETTSSEATTSTENTTTTESTTPTESTTTIATTTTTQTESTPVTTTETTTEITTTTAETTSNSVETTTPKVTVENTTITTTTEQTLAETEIETTTTTENITTTSNVETSTEPTQNTIEKEFENLKLQVTLDINKSEKDTITAVLSTTDDSNIPSDIQVTVGGNPVDTRFYMYNNQTGAITFNLDAINETLAENETIEDFLNAVEIETLEDTSETTTTDEAPEIDDISNLTIKGDANGDEEVNAVDLLLAKKYVLQMVQKSEISFENADINDDGDVNSVDILMLKKYILQIIDKFD